MKDRLQTKTCVSHAAFTRRSVVTITLDGDITQRQAIAQSIETWLAEQTRNADEPTLPALASVFALLTQPEPESAPAEASLPVLPRSRPHTPINAYDEPFLLAPIDEENLSCSV